MPVRVLIVDDDPAFRDLARRMLTAADLEVVGEAETGARAITAAEAMRPDAALVDVDLPDGTGVALARKLTSMPWHPRVLLTSVDPEAVRPEEVNGSGAKSFVPKAELADGAIRRLLAE